MEESPGSPRSAKAGRDEPNAVNQSKSVACVTLRQTGLNAHCDVSSLIHGTNVKSGAT